MDAAVFCWWLQLWYILQSVFFKTNLPGENAVELKTGSQKNREQEMRNNVQKLCLRTHWKGTKGLKYCVLGFLLSCLWAGVWALNVLRLLNLFSTQELFCWNAAWAKPFCWLWHPALSSGIAQWATDLNCKWKLSTSCFWKNRPWSFKN